MRILGIDPGTLTMGYGLIDFHNNELSFVSMSRTKDNTNINLDIYPKKFENLIKKTNSIKNSYKNSKVVVARSNDLSL